MVLYIETMKEYKYIFPQKENTLVEMIFKEPFNKYTISLTLIIRTSIFKLLKIKIRRKRIIYF